MAYTAILSPSPQYRFPIRMEGTKSGLVMSATAIPFPDANRMTFELMFGKEIVLHFDIRFNYIGDTNTVVLNTFHNGKWGKEQRPTGFPFKHNTIFHLKIKAGDKGFHIFVNRQHYVDYSYAHIPAEVLSKISELHVFGGLRIYSMKYNGF